MSLHLIYFVLLVSPVLCRHVPNFSDLDEEEQHLFRAAYDTHSYEHDEYEEDLPSGKIDLLKDSLWAVKAKIKELKAFNKAMAANMLSTKLKVKDLLKNHLKTVTKHHHEKPTHSYAPAYHAPAPAYPQYEAPAAHYSAPAQQYGYEPQYSGQQYGHEPQYSAPQYGHEPQYPAPQYLHDPYYGH